MPLLTEYQADRMLMILDGYKEKMYRGDGGDMSVSYEDIEKVRDDIVNREKVNLTTAVPVLPDFVVKMVRTIERSGIKNAVLELNTDVRIGGGCVIGWRGKLYDYSLAKKIEAYGTNNISTSLR